MAGRNAESLSRKVCSTDWKSEVCSTKNICSERICQVWYCSQWWDLEKSLSKRRENGKEMVWLWYISKSLNFCLGGQTYSCTFFRRMRKDIPCHFASQSKLTRFKPSSFIFPGWSDFLNYLMASCRLHFFPLYIWIVCKCVADGQTVQLNCGCITSIWLACENSRFSSLLAPYNIVENHLNIALLNVFSYLNGRYRHIFIP